MADIGSAADGKTGRLVEPPRLPPGEWPGGWRTIRRLVVSSHDERDLRVQPVTHDAIPLDDGRHVLHPDALDVVDRWAKAFEGIEQNMPNWYVGAHGMAYFHPVAFSQAITATTSHLSTATFSAPRSSGGSGGGGFSGGGGGGGGGGSW